VVLDVLVPYFFLEIWQLVGLWRRRGRDLHISLRKRGRGMVEVVCTVLAGVCFGDDLDNVLAVYGGSFALS